MIDLILKFFGLQRIPKKSNKIVKPQIIKRKKPSCEVEAVKCTNNSYMITPKIIRRKKQYVI